MKSPNQSPQPPRWAHRLLTWLHPPDTREEVEGDLAELYTYWYRRAGKTQATFRYVLNVVSVLPPFVRRRQRKQDYYQPFLLNPAVLRNYLKIAWRNLAKNKVYSVINIGGLAVGMAVAMLIGLWVRYELSFDQFHANRQRVSMMMKHVLFNDEKGTGDAVPLPLYDELKNSYPEVARVSRIDWGNPHTFKAGDTRLTRPGLFVDPDFLAMFSFPLLAGNAGSALRDPASIVLTESMAKALFGEKEPLGQLIRLDNQHDLRVTGIARDVPKNSTLQFECLIPFELNFQINPWMKTERSNWQNNFLRTAVELQKETSSDTFSAKIASLIRQKSGDKKEGIVFAFPVADWHLRGRFENWQNVGGRIDYVRLFGLVGMLVLLIACINFMNLSTARSEKRAKEVGIRKAVGSVRLQLAGQFLVESLLTTVLAFGLSLGLVALLFSSVNDLGFAEIPFDFINIPLLAGSFVLCVLTGLLAGSYPAFYLSSFAPVKVLKGRMSMGKNASLPRKILVAGQFTFSIALIISTIIVFQQIQYAKKRPMGYNPDNLISIPGTNDLAKNYNVLKQDLLSTGLVEAVTSSSSPMTNINNVWGDWTWPGKDPNRTIAFAGIFTGYDYVQTAGLRLKKGRTFSRNFPTDSSAILLNETAVRTLGWKEPLGKIMKAGDDSPRTVIGVVEDVVMDDPFRPVIPAVILFNSDFISTITVRLKPAADVKKALAAIQPLVERQNPAYPFEYTFVDEEFARKFSAENQAGRLAGIFAILAIFISCLGLFGLASFMAEARTKEIGVRKVLGASVLNLWGLLSKDFVVLVVIAFFIATPLAYYFLNNWLQQYQYRTEISWWIFAVSGAGALAITLLTVSFQSIKAALMNPVKSLRSE